MAALISPASFPSAPIGMAPSTSVTRGESPSDNEFVVAKRRHFFNYYLDTDRDGSVRWNDLELLLENVIEVARKDEFIRAKMTLVGIWHDLTDHRPNTNEITMEEWLGLFSSSSDCQDESSLREHFFTLFDPSGDMMMDESEYIHVLAFFGRGREEAMSCFERVGRSPTGEPVYSIDAKRFAQLWNEYFFSTDPTTDGSFLFGYMSDPPEDDEDEIPMPVAAVSIPTTFE